MADIGAVHHHAAHQRELFNGRPNEVNVSPELTPVIRQGFKHAAACGRAFAVGEIVRMAFERAQMDFRVPLERGDGDRSHLKEAALHRLVTR